MTGLFDDANYGDEYDTPMAYALDDAIVRHAEEDAAELARAFAETVLHVYDPSGPMPDPRMYGGTGIGVLYGLTDPKGFDLGDWRVEGVTA